MKWTRRTAYSIASGGYIICRVTMWGKDGYCVFHGEEWVGHYDSAAEAKQAAQDHRRAA